MPTEAPADLITVFVALLTLFLEPNMAKLLAPYAVIVLCAIAGAGIGVSGKYEQLQAMPSIIYVTTRVILASAITVSLAVLLQRFTGESSSRWLVAPIALAIGYFRDRQQLSDFVKWVKSLKNIFSSDTPGAPPNGT